MKKLILILFASIIILTTLFFNLFDTKNLHKIPKADAIGIIKNVKEIKIKNVSNPLNASIEDFENNYILTFRIQKNKFDYIGLTFLNQNLEEIGEYKKIDTHTLSSQDPRIFKYQNEYFLIFNDKLDIKHDFYRTMFLAKLNLQNFKIEYKTSLDQHIKMVEKNWVPFTYENKLFLAYGLMPHKILEVIDTKKNNLKHLVFENNPCLSRFYWKWGEPRGGTPAKLVDNEYLAFFHSSFGKKKKSKYYVMGAYTFQANSPFKITKVTKFPILFGNIKKTRVYFPTGFCIKKENDKTMIYLSYGENDKTSKIVIIDKEKLFENMRLVD